ncbi:MAG TPA: hypothetical protein VFR67_08335, partial [Pilimelia sp.]|nr:hypothetical protein [Pilimelia sp.]
MIRDPSPRAQGITVLSDDSGLFTGRAAALAEISAWLDNPRAAATLVLTGASGSGKSALLARVWATWAGGGPAWSRGGRTAVGGGVAHHVAARRSAAVAPAGAGPGVDVAIDAYGRTTSEVLATLCAAAGCTGTRPADLLAATRRRSDSLVALVDGIDSACDPEHLVTTLLGPLSRATDGDHLRLLLCSRPASLESLIGSARIVDLDRPEYSSPEDMRTYTIRCLTEMADWSPYRLASPAFLAQVVDIVLAAAGPSFLVALIVARNLANRPAPVNPSDPLWRVSLPTTPAAAVAWDLATRLGPHDARKAEDLLVPLAYAQGAGLPWDDVWADVASAASGRSYTDEDVSWLRRAVGWYVLEVADAGRLVYRPAYRAVTDHLRASRDDRTVHAAFTSVLAEGVRIGMHGTPEWSDVSSYTSTHIATHAAAAGLLDQLLCDPHFLLSADRARLLTALPSTRSAQGRAAADAYRTCPPPADEARWLAELDIAAHCARATTLAAAFDRLRTPRPWAVRWAHWSAPRPCRTMAGGHVGAILSAATLRLGDTRLAVTGGDDGTVRVWDIAAGRPIGPPLVGAGGPVQALAATVLDGRATAVAAGKGEGGIVRRWDLMADVATAVQTPTTADVTAVALTQVGGATWAITGGSDGSLATWDLASGRPVLPAIRAHDHEIRSIVVTSFGAWVLAVTTATDRTARTWVLGTGQPDGQPLVGRPGGIGAAAIVPWHGRAIAVTADATGTLDLWDLAVARHAGALMPGSAGVVDVIAATAIDTRPVAVTGSPDGVVRVWDLASG